MNLPAEIFRAYDIRGIVGRTLDEGIARAIGRGIGTLSLERGARAVVVGRDGRLSGPALAAALGEGIASAGADVVDVGMVPTPAAYFAAHHLGAGSCAMVTGSHNPPEYNGIKMVVAGDALSGEEIQGLRRRIEAGKLASGAGTLASGAGTLASGARTLASGSGTRREAAVLDAYVARIAGDVRLARPMRIAIDCGNGVAGVVATRLFRALGCEVEELYCDVDGTFPNHHPDPSQPKNLVDLVRALARGGAELGLAFDGDGDRLGVVTKDGEAIFPDRQLMLFAADVLSRNPGAEILYDVKCTRLLAPWIERHGGRATICRTGHSLVKAALKAAGAPLAGEMSGHTFFKERWYGFDDALYAGARLLEIVSTSADASAPLKALPDAPCTPELNWKLAEGEPHALVARLQAARPFPGAARIIDIDGVRVEYADGFGLARASNTTPVIVLRFEGDTPEAMRRIQETFRAALQPLKPQAPLPF